jgi:hypothetical protein
MHLMKLILPMTIVAAGLLICTSSIYGTPEYAKKEKQTCTHCHAKVVGNKADMIKNLNATGTCYKDSGHSLAKCSTSK